MARPALTPDGVAIHSLERTGRKRPALEAGPEDILVAEVATTEEPLRARRRLLATRRAIPWAPLILIPASPEPEQFLALGALAAEVAARAVVHSMDGDLTDVVQRLCGSDDLPLDCARWVRVQRPRLKRLALERIEALVRAGMQDENVHHVAARYEVTVRDFQTFFRRARLAVPSAYVKFGRMGPGICLLQGNRGSRLIDAACTAGYSTRSAFSRALRESLAASADDIRGRVGFEWAAYQMRLHYDSGDVR